MGKDDKQPSFAALFEGSAPVRRARNPRVGDRLEAVVVHIGRDAVFVELDGKQQAFLDVAELRAEDGSMTVRVGDRVSAYVVEVDHQKSSVRLGRSMGRGGGVAALEQAKASRLAVEGKVTGVNKGGLDVDIGGTRAFCPISQADDKFVEDPSALVGQTFSFAVTDVRDGGKNVVVSRRAWLEREASEAAARLMHTLLPGAVVHGTVSAVRDFGAFVDLGGVEGLIPRSEIGHDRSQAVAEVLKPGDAVEVQILEVKTAEAGRAPKISLSLKALTADPWAEMDLVEGRVVVGTVGRIADFGWFVRLRPGVDGLLPISELAPGSTALAGQEITVVVKKIDREQKRVSLVLAPDGIEAGATLATTTVAVGAIVRGTVARIEAYGIFVQLEGTKDRAGRGLVPTAELGVPRGTDVRKAFPIGQEVTAKVLETGERKLRLSIKDALSDAERADYEAMRSTTRAPSSLGTLGDLFKAKKR
jgi:small subunit ribosomal protein S1